MLFSIFVKDCTEKHFDSAQIGRKTTEIFVGASVCTMYMCVDMWLNSVQLFVNLSDFDQK